MSFFFCCKKETADEVRIRDWSSVVCSSDLVISARAFAPLDKLLALGERFATPTTRWILPKGRNAKSELEAVESSWQGVFRLERSLTDDDAQIIVAEQIGRAHV